jgi:hypothetical protein
MLRPLGLRLRALLALAAFVGTFSLPLISVGHLAFDDDRACGSIELAGYGADARFAPAQAPIPQNHCALCHWLRAVGGASTSDVSVTRVWLERGDIAAPVVLTQPVRPALTHGPSRAPPTVLS